MMKLKQGLLYLSIAVFALGTGFLVRTQLIEDTQSSFLSSDASKKGAEKLFALTLMDVHGEQQAISQWRGSVLVVNFWATWCAPCREEIPEFIEVQSEYYDQGLRIIGIAMDRQEKVAAYSKEFGINYPVLIASSGAMSIAEETGNPQAALPFTIIINRDGKITNTYLGRVHREKLENAVKPLL